MTDMWLNSKELSERFYCVVITIPDTPTAIVGKALCSLSHASYILY